ncbi:zinc finger protein-domain-containing protein [Schizothecium vesticola]|uniref:Zinc finger protein-domain-containing protein n=1 Tax=Schizothecium vesticola TaxID=314040 RepID=A0AA40FAM6_9PEZI|nr:zinc finger protein-domain-containing protein [Schizothecium vesticola]
MHKHILSNIGPFHITIPQHIAFLQPGSSNWSHILPRLPADSSRHCLIRPYLGRRRVDSNALSGRRSMLKSISLRDYPLHIDQMEALDLPVHIYASAMADGLAFLLWVAEVDACDVEFVLARPRPLSGEDNVTYTSPDTFTFGPLEVHTLWILDFDCCKKLPMTSEGVKIAAERFWRNDPFYPNPNAKCEEDAALWDVFEHRFLKTSAEMMAS